jgi:hypothetical protein
MACKNCKNKETLKEEMLNSTKLVESWVIWFAVIWTGLAIYGLITLIGKIL